CVESTPLPHRHSQHDGHQRARPWRPTSQSAGIPAYVAAAWLGHCSVIADKPPTSILNACSEKTMRRTMRTAAATSGQQLPGETDQGEIAEKIATSRCFVDSTVGDTRLELVTSTV